MPRTLPIVAAPQAPQYTEHPSALPVYRWRLRWRDEQRPTAPRQDDHAAAVAPAADDRAAWSTPPRLS